VRVHAHATTIDDQKDALRAGADVLVHMVQNTAIVDELAALVREKKPYWATVIALGDRSDVCADDPFFTQALSARIVADIKATACAPNANAAGREARLKENFTKMIASGARLILGADTVSVRRIRSDQAIITRWPTGSTWDSRRPMRSSRRRRVRPRRSVSPMSACSHQARRPTFWC
jgi:imidazolonepropionase-like amidohydrolase